MSSITGCYVAGIKSRTKLNLRPQIRVNIKVPAIKLAKVFVKPIGKQYGQWVNKRRKVVSTRMPKYRLGSDYNVLDLKPHIGGLKPYTHRELAQFRMFILSGSNLKIRGGKILLLKKKLIEPTKLAHSGLYRRGAYSGSVQSRISKLTQFSLQTFRQKLKNLTTPDLLHKAREPYIGYTRLATEPATAQSKHKKPSFHSTHIYLKSRLVEYWKLKYTSKLIKLLKGRKVHKKAKRLNRRKIRRDKQVSHSRHYRFQSVLSSRILKKRYLRKFTKSLLYRLRKKLIRGTGRRRHFRKTINKKFMGFHKLLQISLSSSLYNPLITPPTSIYRTISNTYSSWNSFNFSRRFRFMDTLSVLRGFKQKTLVAAPYNILTRGRFRAHKKLFETRSASTTNRFPFLHFKTSTKLIKLGAPEFNIVMHLKILPLTCLIPLLMKPLFSLVSITEVLLLNFFTLFSCGRFLLEGLLYKSVLYENVYYYKFEKNSLPHYLGSTAVSQEYISSIKNILNANTVNCISFPKQDYPALNEISKPINSGSDFGFGLKSTNVTSRQFALTNHFLTSWFFREAATLKTRKTFPRATLTLTRLFDAGRHRARVLNLDKSSTDSFNTGINFRVASSLWQDHKSLMSLQFTHFARLSLLRRQPQKGIFRTNQFYSGFRFYQTLKLKLSSSHKNPYLALGLQVDLFLRTVRLLCGGLLLLRKKQKTRKKFCKPRKPTLPTRTRFSLLGSVEGGLRLQPLSSMLARCKHLNLKGIRLSVHSLSRIRFISRSFTVARRLSTYLKLKRRFFNYRHPNLVNYWVYSSATTPRKKSINGIDKNKKDIAGRDKPRIPSHLRRGFWAAKKAKRRLKDRTGSFRTRRIFGRKNLYYKNNKSFIRKHLFLRKKILIKFWWSLYTSKRRLVRFNSSLKRRRKSPIPQTNRLSYPFLSYTKYSKNSKFWRRKLFSGISGPKTLMSPARVVDYFSPTLSLLKVNCTSHVQTVLLFILNPLLLSFIVLGSGFQNRLDSPESNKISCIGLLTSSLFYRIDRYTNYRNSQGIFASNNLVPSKSVSFIINKEAYNLLAVHKLMRGAVPFYYHTLVRFMEHCSGKKAAFKFYPFAHQNVKRDFYVRYKVWMARMGFYERRLGHKFFLQEAIHIMHISFFMKDAKLLCSWFKAMILRISFWKTRSIFRFIKYLMLGYFYTLFPSLDIKGFKIKLKGKISVAGNSRKRRVIYRVGETSHSQASLRVLYEFVTINTFTGVMGFQLWIFY